MNVTPEDRRAVGGYILQVILGATVIVAVFEDMMWLIIVGLVLLVCQRISGASGGR